MKKRLVYLLFLMTAGCLQDLPPGQDITDPATADHMPNIIVAGSRAPGVAFDTVNTGTGANTGTGDPIRTAFDKLNEVVNVANDVELYNVTSPVQTQLNARGRTASVTANLSAGAETDVTLVGVTGEPYSVQIFDANGNNITHAVKDSTAAVAGTYHTWIYSTDAKVGAKIKILW